MAEPLLAIERVSKRFRGLRAVANVSFEVPSGHIVALIGPNSVPRPPMIGPKMISIERPMLKTCSGNSVL